MASQELPALPWSLRDGKIVGLPVTGLMGTQPAVTSASVMAAIYLVVTFLVTQGILPPLPPELTAITDQYGEVVTTAFIVLVGYIIKNRVPSPNTAARLAPDAVVPGH